MKKQFRGHHYIISLRSRLILGFIVATCLTGIVATVMGIRAINKNTIGEVQQRVRQDLNTARFIYDYNLTRLASEVRFAAQGSRLDEALSDGKIDTDEALRGLVQYIYAPKGSDRLTRLDMLAVVNVRGEVVYRVFNPSAKGDSIISQSIVERCLRESTAHASTEIMDIGVIRRENPAIGERVSIPIVKTPQSVEIEKDRLTEGMVLLAAHPVFDKDGQLLGALIGGTLVNNNYTIVDKIRETVYRGEKYKGRDIGFATIFQGGVRISTNVMTVDNRRAIGTIVSKEVYDRVMGQGKDWIARAFVVHDWYISSYAPIYDIDKVIIGMLYTGVLEAKYRDIRMQTMWMFLGITFLGGVVAFVISLGMGNSIIRRIRMLKEATKAIAEGNLDYRISRESFDGFDMLDEAFNNMTKSLKDRDDRLQEVFKRLARTERLAALGQMAAGVAHEINNPLGGILLYSNIILEELPEDHQARENLEKIIYQTERSKKIVQNLLDFSRTPSGEMMPFDINRVIETSLSLVKDQSLFLGIDITTSFAAGLPEVKGDRSRLEEVFLNFFVNAADAMDGRGELSISTGLSSANSVKIVVSDTGKGIDKAYLPHIFEPFFTTKEPGQGTGLGLSIAYGIIQQHNGIIDVESEPGKGTTFIISLPVAMGT